MEEKAIASWNTKRYANQFARTPSGSTTITLRSHPRCGQVVRVVVRQSTDAQVMEHGESTARQYALADRAVQLGWEPEGVQIIDEDLGRSGASTQGRSGFAYLADAVAHGKVGAVLALEVSRLARSSNDWMQLLCLCAVARVLAIDEQTIVYPRRTPS